MTDFTDAEKILRRSGVTASNMAAVVGLDPNKSSQAVWRWVVDGTEQPRNAFMEHGNKVEGPVLAWVEAQTGRKMTKPGTVRSSRYERVLATPDGILGDNTVVEAKYVSTRSKQPWGEPGTDQVPDHIIIQVQTQLLVMDMETAFIPVLREVSSSGPFNGGLLSVYVVHRDYATGEMLAQAATEWWDRYVATKTIPPRRKPAKHAKEAA